MSSDEYGVHVLDNYYLAFTLLTTITFQLLFFLPAYYFKTDKLYDIAAALNYVYIAMWLLGAGVAFEQRNLVVLSLISIWALRLGIFRLVRLIKRGGIDKRFNGIQDNVFRLGGYWLFQAIWIWITAIPIIIMSSPGIIWPVYGGYQPRFGSVSDILGIILIGIGGFMEIFADHFRYHYEKKRVNQYSIYSSGLWKWSRNPNIFGQIVMWWGYWLALIQPARENPRYSDGLSTSGKVAIWCSILSPIFVTVMLVFVIGVPKVERSRAKRFYLLSHGIKPIENGDPWSSYKQYLAKTSILLPLPPFIYSKVPDKIKKAVLLDLDRFRFLEGKHGALAVQEQKEDLDIAV